MDELRNNPQIIRLLETLEENGMHKEKGEVSALVSYIGDMEHTLSAMLAEMQEMRKEVNMIHNSSVKAKCEKLIHTADSKIRQGIETVSKAKNNLIASAANAVKVFKEKGKEAFKNSINAMKISDTLDKLGKVLYRIHKHKRINTVERTVLPSRNLRHYLFADFTDKLG